ncbi:DUF2218 domain-containing protein [Aestuariispira ectoiniformans]|uniref:DUF2218 domain-containing protein n=1 Tax=Aestuariispira ectoiniformans TaxID=2775080 RepID=UPI00223BDD29|nr:DUF2218 domain-containing protein [Aestuariispira ectoiniformans]
MFENTATVTTEKAAKYLVQLCKHFAHKVEVDYCETSGTVHFPPGPCAMHADENTLTMQCRSESLRGVLMMQGILDSHLERFAWREEITIPWPKLDGEDAVRAQVAAEQQG